MFFPAKIHKVMLWYFSKMITQDKRFCVCFIGDPYKTLKPNHATMQHTIKLHTTLQLGGVLHNAGLCALCQQRMLARHQYRHPDIGLWLSIVQPGLLCLGLAEGYAYSSYTTKPVHRRDAGWCAAWWCAAVYFAIRFGCMTSGAISHWFLLTTACNHCHIL